MERLLRLPQVMSATGMGRSTLYAAVQRGQFPAPIALADARISVWAESDVQRWIERQIAAARTAPGAAVAA